MRRAKGLQDFLLDPFTYWYMNSTYQRNRDPPVSYEGQHTVDVLAGKAIGFLDEAFDAGKPFFLGIAPVAPHSDIQSPAFKHGNHSNLTEVQFSPPIPAKRHAHLFPKAKVPRTPNFNPDKPSGASWIRNLRKQGPEVIEYNDNFYVQRLRALQSVDELVDSLVRRLENLGILDDTYVIYSTDNGYHIGQHRLNPSKQCSFEEDINIPLIIRGPGVPEAFETDIVTTHTDLAPTLLHIAGAPERSDFDGLAIPLTQAGLDQAKDERHEHITVEHWGFASNEGRILDWYPRLYVNNTYKAMRVVGKSYNLHYQVWCNNEHELYDLTTDPGQMVNLLHPDERLHSTLLSLPLDKVVQRLDSLLFVLKSCRAQTCIHPWRALHPGGDVETLKDALSLRFDEFYQKRAERIKFDRWRDCDVGTAAYVGFFFKYAAQYSQALLPYASSLTYETTSLLPSNQNGDIGRVDYDVVDDSPHCELPPKTSTPGNCGTDVEANGVVVSSNNTTDSPKISTSSLIQIVSVLTIGLFTSNIDSSLVIAIHPRIASEFDALEDSSWIFVSFLLGGVATQVLYAKLSDIYGRRDILVFCYALFGTGWSFSIQAPLFAAAMIASILVIPNTKAPEPQRETATGLKAWLTRVDLAGSLLLGAGVLLFMLPIELGGVRVPWTHPIIFGLFGSGILILGLFVINEARWAKEPAIPLWLMTNRDVLLPYLATCCIGGAQTSLMYFVPLYFQVTAGVSNTVAGLHLVPAVIGNANRRLQSSHLRVFVIRLNWIYTTYRSMAGGFGAGMSGSAVFVALNAAVDPVHKAAVTSGLQLALPIGMLLGVTAGSAVMLDVLQRVLDKNLLEAGLNLESRTEIIEKSIANVDYIRQIPELLREIVIGGYVVALRSSFGVILAFSVTGLIAGSLLRERSYRLYLSPLSSIPGPKLAALTGWVEAYYELLHGEGGQFMFKYREWHEKYGPIVRISPHEVHIQDSSFFETLYTTNRVAWKRKELQYRFNNPKSSLATPDHTLHRIRRGALNPFFSKRAISERAQIIQDYVDTICQRLKNEFQNTDRILVVNDMWGCLTTDIIIEYCFEKQYNFIHEPNFQVPLVKSLFDLLEGVHWVTQFPWLVTIMGLLPDAVVVRLNPRMESVINYNNEMLAQVSEAIKNADRKEQPDTIFTSIVQSDIPRSEVTPERLQHEAISVVGGGIETTMRALTVSVYHIANNPSTYRRLHEELLKAIPDPEKMPSWAVLQNLPYLAACVEETLRLSYGSSQRISRLYSHAIVYGGYALPKGTTISMTTYDISHDETIFPDSFEYRPERWLGNPRSSDGRRLSRYMVSFGRGPRSCVGMQLAYAELYIGLATIFRLFSFELTYYQLINPPFANTPANMLSHKEKALKEQDPSLPNARLDTVITRDEVFGEITEDGPNYRNVGWLGTVAIMMKTQIGLGVLSIPAAFDALGLIPGVIILVVVAGITTWSSYMVGVFKRLHPNVYSIDDAGDMMFGRAGRYFFGITFCFLWTLVAGSGMLSISIALNAVSTHGTCTAVFVAVAAILGFGFASIRTLGRITWLAWIGITGILTSVFLVTIAVGVQDRPAAAPQEGPWASDFKLVGNPSFTEAITAVSSIILAYLGTPAFFAVVSEMRDPRLFTRSMLVSQGAATTVYITVGTVVYYFCGSYVASPALGSAGVLVKKIAYGIALPGLIVSTTILTHIPAKYIFVRILSGSRHLSESTPTHWISWFSCTAGITIIAYVVANAVPVFGGLVSLIGALFGTIMTFQPMGCMWLYDNWHRKDEGRTLRWYATASWSVLVIVLGTFLTIAGTYGSIHRDAFGRVLDVYGTHTGHEHYLRPEDGRLALLRVQGIDDTHEYGQRSWERTGRPQSKVSLVMKLTHWTYSSVLIPGSEERLYTFNTVLPLILKWIPSCILLAILLLYPQNLEGVFQNGGYYDPIQYRDWRYPKVSRNRREGEQEAFDEDEDAGETHLFLEGDIEMNIIAPRSLQVSRMNDGTIEEEFDDLPARHFGPRYLCFLRDGPRGPDTEYETWKVTDWIQQHADHSSTDFVFISYTRSQFLIDPEHKWKNNPVSDESTKAAYYRLAAADRAMVLAYGMEAARSAKKRAFWIDFECIRDADNVARETAYSNDVYRICDIVRAAHSLVVLLGPPHDTRLPREARRHHHSPASTDQWLQEWGTRLWTLPEILLCPSERRVKLYIVGGPNPPEEIAKRNIAARSVWPDAKLVRQLIDHYESSIHLTPLELVSIALECFSWRQTDKFSNGDISYALMGLLRRRPAVDKSDKSFEAFARLSLANDSDNLLERLICMQPICRDAPWHQIRDAWGARLWDIEPRCQIAGIVDDQTVTLDGAFGATIQWDAMEPVAFLKRPTLSRLLGKILLRGVPGYWIIALGATIYGALASRSSDNPDSPGTSWVPILVFLIPGIVLIIPTTIITLIIPSMLLNIYQGKFWSTQAHFLGLEGIPSDIGEIERILFGFNHGRLKWSIAGSTLSRNGRSKNGERIGLPPRKLGSFDESAHDGETIFTLIDTYAMTATAFRATKPPTTVIVCGHEGGMQRAVLCSYDWQNGKFVREAVIRVKTLVLDRMFRVDRFRFALGRRMDNM
ncbi:hypothetical protein NUW58_g683 [Xylaria curta]|uniref:Uncharacterized protein n=1 Tax=Xylaria curta TaxID=42375 RepID=A0ACC1PPA8_9PEZI|nr:hypothetical protein NUW58_g683 [Xylaria curta]